MQTVKYFFPGARWSSLTGSILPNQVAKRWSGTRVINSGYTGPKPKSLNGVFHPFSYEAWDVSMTSANFSVGPNRGKYTGTYGDDLHPAIYGLDFPEAAAEMSAVYNQALDELNEKTRGSLDLSVDIAEMGQTARMFKVVDQVVDWYRMTRLTAGKLKLVGNWWLQYQYGVKPLLSSIHGSVAELERFVLNKTARFRARASRRVNSRAGYYTPSGLYSYVPKESGVSVKLSTQLGICLDQRDFDPTRLTSMNPLSIAWELTPYSFVADWFYDIGGYLRNLETSLLYANRFKSGYRTDLMVVDAGIDYMSPPAGGDQVVTRKNGHMHYVSVTRSILPSYPGPRLPTFGANLGSSRLLSAAALLSTGLKSHALSDFKVTMDSWKYLRARHF